MLSKLIDRHPSMPGFAEGAAPEPNDRDRRRRTRILVHWPLCFFGSGVSDGIETTTHDLSSDGFYCVANAPFVPGEIRECTLGVPTHRRGFGERFQSIHCRVRVIRVEALRDGGPFGIGCRIEDYSFVRSGSPLNNSASLEHASAEGND